MTIPSTSRVLSATASRRGRWWQIDIPELNTGGQSPSIREIPEIAAEIAGEYLAVEPCTLEVRTAIELPGAAAGIWAEANQREARGRAEIIEAARLRRDTLRSLAEQGLSQADIARLLRLTPQRVSQLMNDTDPAAACPESPAG
ncbi:hypothetical protein [Mycetocola spongiae]|uniref:hypothetical protein n=1 Tax=Mycetocola spongiae TaxID=2859226 RepID=UPI001CF57A9A|nr:hypothetical protein [Mycetocola spongiae]UCR88346.1 hypothetical protein KXZ72_10245 [Mycetocola spongiae]